jgi:hypothetical protein
MDHAPLPALRTPQWFFEMWELFLPHPVQLVLEALSPAIKRLGGWSWPLTFIWSRDQERWNYTSSPPQTFMARRQCYLFTFTMAGCHTWRLNTRWWPALWSSDQSSWLQNVDVLCFLWSTNWIYICYVEESRSSLWSSGQSSWLQNGDVLCFLWGTNWIYILCRRK